MPLSFKRNSEGIGSDHYPRDNILNSCNQFSLNVINPEEFIDEEGTYCSISQRQGPFSGKQEDRVSKIESFDNMVIIMVFEAFMKLM